MRVEIEQVRSPPVITLRAEDAMECRAIGLEPEEGLALHFSSCDAAFVGRIHGEIAAVFGYRPMSLLGLQAAVWMFSTSAINRMPISAGRMSLEIVERLLVQFPVLVCWVHVDYPLALKWVQWLGFQHASNCGDFMEMRAVRGGR